MTDAAINVLVNDGESERAIPRGAEVRVFREPLLRIARRALNLFVLAPASDLSSVAEFVSVANRRHQLRALFVRDDMDLHWLPRMLDRANLRAIRNMLVHSDAAIPRRVMTAWKHGAQEDLIADARVIDGRLFLISCALKPFEIGFEETPALKTLERRHRADLEIAEDGSYINWSPEDIHLDLDAIRAVLDPGHARRRAVAGVAHDRIYGRAIARVRQEKGLRQMDIHALSERQVRRIESGGGVSLASLERLAKAHGMRLDDYMNAVAEETAGYAPEDPPAPGVSLSGKARRLPAASRATRAPSGRRGRPRGTGRR